MSFTNIKLEIKDKIAWLYINRESKGNALNKETVIEIDQALNQIENNPDIRVLIIRGAGEKFFVAGADVNEFKGKNALDIIDFIPLFQKVLNRLEELPIPVIAAINGYALGGGCELSQACDIRIAKESAKLGQPEINLGIIPGAGGTQRLSRLTNKGFAKDLIFTGRMVSASEAERKGLVDRVVPDDKLDEEIEKLANELAKKSPTAIRLAKEAINKGYNMPLNEALNYEIYLFSLCFDTEEKEKLVTAFLEKRK